jgi:hypothetical protein
MTPTQALEILRHFLMARLPQERLKEFNDAYEVLRKLVVDDIARKKNATETEKIARKEP